jgi:ribosomal subunit interface protein
MEIIFKGRHTEVASRFRDQAAAKLERLEKLDQKAIRVDVEVSVERNPRQSSQKERVELTIVSRGPVIRAEAAAEDRFAALDLAMAKLDSRLRRALDRRKRHQAAHGSGRAADRISDRVEAGQLMLPEDMELPAQRAPAGQAEPGSAESMIAIPTEGDGPLVVRQKFHHAAPIAIDQALLEMELVGHDFYLFQDIDSGMPSVVYRRRGYQYGVIRLVEEPAWSGQGTARAGAPADQGRATAAHAG